jgi:hypothetical protein
MGLTKSYTRSENHGSFTTEVVMKHDYDEEIINVFDMDLNREEFLFIQKIVERILKEQRIKYEYNGFKLQIFYATEDADE